MQLRNHRNPARGIRKPILTHLRRNVLIDQLESRVLLSTGGSPDPGFGQGGYLKGYQVLAVQQDGSLIARADTPSGHALVQLHPDGSFEANYTGPTPTPPPTNVQADGKYLVINGASWVSGNTLTRHNPDGSVDTSFGNNGSVSDFTSGTGYPAGAFNPENVTVVGNHILVGGPLNLGGEQQPWVMALVQLNPDGSIDHSFGSSGIAKGSDQVTNDVKTYQMLVGPNGNYFESGEVFGFPSITEFTPGGGLVSFVELQNSGEDRVYGLGFSRKNVYLLADWTSSTEGLAAYDLNLKPDTGFGNSGLVVVIPPDHSPSEPLDGVNVGPMIVDPAGRIFVSGSFDYLDGSGGDYAIAYLPDWGANTSVSGFIYNDANGNGRRDTGETPLRYWQAFVDLNGNGLFDKYEPTAYADYNGYYKIHALDPGSYKVYEVQPAGWTRTQPSPLPYYSFTVASGAVATGNDFGNRQGTSQPGSISGTFFYDGNHNGVWDAGEAPSPSWGVYIDANNDGRFDSGDTEIIANAHGQYTFANLAPGTYVIRGTTASGWTQTFPANGGAEVVTVGSGQNVTGVNFGEYHGIVSSRANGSISGTFFYDGNANGVWDAGEAPSPSWGVYIDANDDGIYDSGDKEIIANAHGQYTFSNLSAGTYVIRATTASGWKQTYPANGGAEVITLASGQNFPGANFGKVRM